MRYVTPDAHERACRAVAVATHAVRPAPLAVRLARSPSQQPNALERVMQLGGQLAALGASRADLRAMELALAAQFDDLFARERRPLAPLMADALRAEGEGDQREMVVLLHPTDAAALHSYADTTRREAALELEVARIADAEAVRLEHAR